MTAPLKITHLGSLVRILLNRPHRRNALDEETGRALFSALEEIADRDDLAVVVLEGAGDHFCAGWDLSEFDRLTASDDDEVASYMVQNCRLLRRLGEIPQFTVALVQGSAVGFGAALAVAVDLAVADPNARFYFPEAELGLVPAVVLPALVESLGVRATLLSVLTASPFRAEQALAMGMVAMVADAEDRERFVGRLERLSPSVVRSTKRLASEASTSSPGEVEDLVAKAGLATVRSDEARKLLGAG